MVKIFPEALALIVQMLFETGLCIAEMVQLQLKDFNGRRICFIGKGNKSREVYNIFRLKLSLI